MEHFSIASQLGCTPFDGGNPQHNAAAQNPNHAILRVHSTDPPWLRQPPRPQRQVRDLRRLPPQLHRTLRQQLHPPRFGRRSVCSAPPLVRLPQLAACIHRYHAVRHPRSSLGDAYWGPKLGVWRPHMQGSKKQLQNILLTERDCYSFSNPRQIMFH